MLLLQIKLSTDMKHTVAGKENDILRQDARLQGELPELLLQIPTDPHATACRTTWC